MNAHNLAVNLEKEDREKRLERRIAVYMFPWLLVVDEIVCLSLGQLGASVILQLAMQRHEEGLMILTPSKGLVEWNGIFEGFVPAVATLDDLLHHSSKINTCGEDYRLHDKRRSSLPDPKTSIRSGGSS